MKALVTGGAGFVGRHLVNELLLAGWDVVVADREVPSGCGRPKGPGFCKLDLMDSGNLSEVMRAIQPAVCFHLADQADVDRTRKDPGGIMAVNTLGTWNVARAFGEIHESRQKPHRLTPLNWFFSTFPQTFRRHLRVFWICLVTMLAGAAFGGFVLLVEPAAKTVLPFAHLQGDPSDRVAREESVKEDRLAGGKSSFSSYLMTHNTKVAIFTLALGMTWGIGTLIMLFYNGVILGAVFLDYIIAGESKFLLGWLLPHGSIEIPAIILAGQAGLILAGALIGWKQSLSLKQRPRV